MTILLVLTGESYRIGPQVSRGRGGEESKKRQRLASNSHMKLVTMLKAKNIDTDICMISYNYNEEYDTELCNMYNPYLKYIKLFPSLFPSEEHFINIVTSYIHDEIELSNYSHIVFIRIDLYLKEYFLNNFKLNNDKVLFAHVDRNTNYTNYKGVCHFLCMFPKQYFNWIGCRQPHTAASDLANHIGNNHIGLMIPTLHLISTDLEWNPLYIQVGRHNSLEFSEQHTIYNVTTNCIEQSESIPFWYDILKKEDVLVNLLELTI